MRGVGKAAGPGASLLKRQNRRSTMRVPDLSSQQGAGTAPAADQRSCRRSEAKPEHPSLPNCAPEMVIFICLMVLWVMYLTMYFTMNIWGTRMPQPRRVGCCRCGRPGSLARRAWAACTQNVWSAWTASLSGTAACLPQWTVVDLWTTAMRTRETWARVGGVGDVCVRVRVCGRGGVGWGWGGWGWGGESSSAQAE